VKLKLPYICVSDHIHYDADDGYFTNHLKMKRQLQQEKCSLPIFLGAELTILNAQGDLPKQTASANNLDFTLVGEHFIPGTSITMDHIPESKVFLIQFIQNQPDKLNEIFRIYREMYQNCLRRFHPTVLVHPYSTLIRCDFTHQQLLEDFEAVCAVCQETRTAIELNFFHISRIGILFSMLGQRPYRERSFIAP
jgi:histidinol phosphatase-like PHP family hydrolase